MKVSGNRKTALPFPLTYTINGSECINTSHGGTMPLYVSRRGIKIPPTDCLRFLSSAIDVCKSIAKVARIIETATKFTAKLADYLNFVLL